MTFPVRPVRTSAVNDRLLEIQHFAERAQQHADTARSTTTSTVAREQAVMQQHYIDLEILRTERSVRDWAVPGRIDYPALAVLDPYFLVGTGRRELMTRLLAVAVQQSAADMGHIQLFDSSRNGLWIIAQQGFQRPFLEHFHWVRFGDVATPVPVIVPDIACSIAFDASGRAAMRDARAVAMQSVPLISVAGQILGVLSCHYEAVGGPMEDDQRLFTVLADAAARGLGHRDGTVR